MVTHFNNTSNEKTSVLFWLRKNKPSKKKQGMFPINCRLTIGSIRANDFSTGIQVRLEDWEAKTQTILPTNPNEAEQAELHNQTLQRIKIDLQRIVANFELAGKEYTPQNVVDLYLQKPKPAPIHTLQMLVDEWEINFKNYVELGENALRTLESYQNHNHKIIEYFGKEKNVQSFVPADWEKIRLHIRNTIVTRGITKGQNTSVNTTKKTLIQLRALLELSKKNGWTTKNPFEEETAPKTNPDKIFLTYPQLQELHKAYDKTDVQEIKQSIDVFLFLAYTGISPTDYWGLCDTNNLITKDGRQFIFIPFRGKSPRKKRYGESHVPIFPEAQVLIDKYGGKLEKLPKFKEANKKLKWAWGAIGVSNDMKLKQARHTFINYARTELGLHESTIALIVGHSTTRTTEESYLKRDINTLLKDLERAKL